MVRLTTSIAAVTILAGTALAQSVYYDEQFERSVSEGENLEARNEAVPSDYLAARDFDDLEEYEARDFEELEDREPLSFGAIKHGAGLLRKVFRKKHSQGGGGHHHSHGLARHFGHGMNAASEQQQDQNRRRSDAEDLFERDDEELFSRDYDDIEFEARDFDDLEDYEARDLEELEEREPFSFGNIVHTAKAAHKIFKKHGHHVGKGVDAANQLQNANQNNDRRSDPEDLFEREEFDPELTTRDFEEYLEERGLRAWLKAKLSKHKSHHQPQPPSQPTDSSSDALDTREYAEHLEARLVPRFFRWFHRKHTAPASSDDQQRRSLADAEELEMRDVEEELIAREPGVIHWLKSKFHRHHDNAAPASYGDEQQQYRREFDDVEELEMREFDDMEDLEMRELDDMEDLEMREFDEDVEDVLARDYDNFDELD